MEICDKMLKPCENMELETKLPDEPENVAAEKDISELSCGSATFQYRLQVQAL